MIVRPLLLSLAFLASAELARASTLTLFSSQSEFLSVAPIVSTETFEEFPSSASFTTPEVIIDNVVYFTEPCLLEILGGCWAIVSPGVVSANRFTANNIGTDVLRFGAGQFVNALGFHLLVGGTVNGVPTGQYELRLEEINGDVILLNIGPLPPSVLYLGFLSSSGIRDVTLNALGDFRFNPAFDNVSRGAIQSVPEPNLPVVLSFAIIGLFAFRHHHRT